jgi:hypothetical protein
LGDASVFHQVPSEDQDYINVHIYHPLHDQILENVIYHGPESGGAVGEAEGHDQWFEEALNGLKGCFPLIPPSDLNTVVPPMYIHWRHWLVFTRRKPRENVGGRFWFLREIFVYPCEKNIESSVVFFKSFAMFYSYFSWKKYRREQLKTV